MIDIKDKDVIISVLKDSIEDGKNTKSHLSNINYICLGFIALLIGAIFVLNVFSQNKIEKMAKEHTEQYKEFVSQFDFEMVEEYIEIEQDLDSENALDNRLNINTKAE